jgi:hypothetical protein
MINKELRLLIQEIDESDHEEKVDALLDFLYGDKLQTVEILLDKIDYLMQLADNLTRELVDLRKEQTEPEQKFFPFSTTARKRY